MTLCVQLQWGGEGEDVAEVGGVVVHEVVAVEEDPEGDADLSSPFTVIISPLFASHPFLRWLGAVS